MSSSLFETKKDSKQELIGLEIWVGPNSTLQNTSSKHISSNVRLLTPPHVHDRI